MVYKLNLFLVLSKFFNHETNHAYSCKWSIFVSRQDLLAPWVCKNLLYRFSASVRFFSGRVKRDISLRSAPSSSAAGDADDTRERVPASIFNIASTAHLQDPRLHGGSRESRVYVTVRDVISDSLVAASISMRIYLLKCNKLDRSQISEPSRR